MTPRTRRVPAAGAAEGGVGGVGRRGCGRCLLLALALAEAARGSCIGARRDGRRKQPDVFEWRPPRNHTTAKRTTRDIVLRKLSAEGGGDSGVQNIPPMKSQ